MPHYQEIKPIHQEMRGEEDRPKGALAWNHDNRTTNPSSQQRTCRHFVKCSTSIFILPWRGTRDLTLHPKGWLKWHDGCAAMYNPHQGYSLLNSSLNGSSEYRYRLSTPAWIEQYTITSPTGR